MIFNKETTHVLVLMGLPPEEFKVGRHGLLFRLLDEWTKTTVELNALTKIEDYRRDIERTERWR